MTTTTSSVSNIPKGLHYFPLTIPANLLKDITTWLESDKAEWFSITSNPNSRQVMHFGYSYNYKSGGVHDPAPPIPNLLLQLIKLIPNSDYIPNDYTFNQCIINKYEPGQGISAHIDRQPEYGPVIACFTVGGGATLEFTRYGHDKYSLYTEPGSLYLMTDESRSLWKHAMPGRKKDPDHGDRETRYSITFRFVPKSPQS